MQKGGKCPFLSRLNTDVAPRASKAMFGRRGDGFNRIWSEVCLNILKIRSEYCSLPQHTIQYFVYPSEYTWIHIYIYICDRCDSVCVYFQDSDTMNEDSPSFGNFLMFLEGCTKQEMSESVHCQESIAHAASSSWLQNIQSVRPSHTGR